ncbi:MAG: hypothetical protein J7M20_09640 [Deltaproteobacteria bacterium]|nr:hypothetical protein [Deltaproteobacteria bacterium]
MEEVSSEKELGLNKPSAMKLRTLTLSFTGKDAPLENDFLDYYYQSGLKQIRYALLLAVFFMGYSACWMPYWFPKKETSCG